MGPMKGLEANWGLIPRMNQVGRYFREHGRKIYFTNRRADLTNI